MLHQIGIGALGPVFRTYEPARDRLIAVKVFRLDIVPEQAQALAQALGRATEASLFHPSIVEPIAAGMEGTVAYRAEEYVAAESLDVAMRHYAPAAVDKALPFITQLAGAIDFARAAGVGHGGLHPRDIFVTPDDARATGFGVVEALEEVGIRAPTRRPYAAPERIEGGAWGTPADVFSLAAITFELLTGRRPSGTGAQIGALPEGDRADALHAILARAMDDDPAKRFGSALAFAAAIEAAGRGQAAPVPSAPQLRIVPPPPPPAPEPPVPEPRAAEEPALELPALDLPEPATIEPPIEAIEPPPARRKRRATPPPIPDLPVLPTPGEFEVEKKLDPVLKAIDDDIAGEPAASDAGHRGRLLFDDEPTIAAGPAADDVIAAVSAEPGEEPDRFAPDEFVEAQEAVAEARRPLEAVHETAPPLIEVAEAPMYPASEPDSEPLAPEEEERSHILPYAVVLVLGLLGGFGAAWFLINRGGNTAPPAAEAPAAVTPSPAATPAPGPATAEKPGQYSEQKVTPPGGAQAAPSTPAPPLPKESAKAAAPPAAPPKGRPDAASTRGRLVVTSAPSRAGVVVNGTWRGRTPLTLDDLAPGLYVIRVVQPGFVPAREEVTLTARNRSHEFNARLERSATSAGEATGRENAPRPAPRPAAPAAAPSAPETFTGSLFVDSRPRGATVFVDGRSVGQTPLSLPDIPVGSHVVKLEMTGKKPWSTSTRVTSGQTARVTGSLEDR